MDPETSDAVTEWEPVAVGSGTAGLRSLVADEFCGAVTDGLTWAFLLNGRIVGVFDGSVDAFDDTDLTAYQAPSPALPLLFAMRETGGEIRGQYYTQDTPLAEVDRTLSAGSFTGYVELSENVLSGDYYVVYHGGRSMSVAFVGASERLVTGDEAFELAADEVGIYTVTAVDVDVADFPGGASPVTPVTGDATDDAGGGADDETEDVALEQASEPADERRTRTADEADEENASVAEDDLMGGMGIGLDVDAEGEAGGADVDSDEDVAQTDSVAADTTVGGDDAADDSGVDTAIDADAVDDASLPADTGEDRDGDGDPDADDSVTATDPLTADTDSDEGSERDDSPETDAQYDGIGTEVTNGEKHGIAPDQTSDEAVGAAAADTAADTSEGDTDDADATHEGGETDDVVTAERQWQETRRVPALSPDDTMDADAPDEQDDGSVGSAPADAEPDSVSETETATTHDAAADLETRLEQAVDERDALVTKVDGLESQLESVTRERDRLRIRVADLEAEIERIRERVQATEPAPSGQQLSPDTAREGTNLFVRYRSTGKPTLEAARAGEARQGDVVENLRLEYHTTFDSESATIDGDSYEAFLHGTTEWAFSRWIVEELLYEIGRAGHRTDMAPLFDAIPEIDRIQFGGEIPVTVDADGGRSHENRTFDLVFWDSMGDPLFVANVETNRDATTRDAVESLVEDAHTVGTSKETLSGAFFVSSSWFEPEALDSVREATSGGLLSRGSKTSLVKLSRKRGYHLCLVEARDSDFYLSVPEL